MSDYIPDFKTYQQRLITMTECPIPACRRLVHDHNPCPEDQRLFGWYLAKKETPCTST